MNGNTAGRLAEAPVGPGFAEIISKQAARLDEMTVCARNLCDRIYGPQPRPANVDRPNAQSDPELILDRSVDALVGSIAVLEDELSRLERRL
jgi:hypothetical protein